MFFTYKWTNTDITLKTTYSMTSFGDRKLTDHSGCPGLGL